jgi:hypothetical protein
MSIILPLCVATLWKCPLSDSIKMSPWKRSCRGNMGFREMLNMSRKERNRLAVMGHVKHKVNHETFRRWLVEEGLWQARRRRQHPEPAGGELILAHSPQAKGRVERRSGLLQDRLVKAVPLRAISNLAGANAYLEKEFLRELNGRLNEARLL